MKELREAKKLMSPSPAWRRADSWLSALLAVCVGLVWLFFRG